MRKPPPGTRPRVSPQASDRLVALAAIAGAHGLSGEVRLKLFAQSPDSLRPGTTFRAGDRILVLERLKPGPAGPIARFQGVTDRTAAEALRGLELGVPRSALPPAGEGEVYWVDLVGLAVVNEAGDPVGRVAGVENYGASDLLEIARDDGRRVLVPFTRETVPELGDPLVIDRIWLEA